MTKVGLITVGQAPRSDVVPDMAAILGGDVEIVEAGALDGLTREQIAPLAPEGDEPDEISAGDSVAGQPDQDGGEVQEGAQGPNAVPDDPTGKHPHKP